MQQIKYSSGSINSKIVYTIEEDVILITFAYKSGRGSFDINSFRDKLPSKDKNKIFVLDKDVKLKGINFYNTTNIGGYTLLSKANNIDVLENTCVKNLKLNFLDIDYRIVNGTLEILSFNNVTGSFKQQTEELDSLSKVIWFNENIPGKTLIFGVKFIKIANIMVRLVQAKKS